MSEIKHTPGPWHFDTDKQGYGCEFSGFAVHSDRYTVATVITDTESLANAANARLIAAAPDLLEALQALMRGDEDTIIDCHGPREVERARAALTKALGNT